MGFYLKNLDKLKCVGGPRWAAAARANIITRTALFVKKKMEKILTKNYPKIRRFAELKKYLKKIAIPP